MTEAEKRLWYALRAKRFEEYKFRRQHPIGRYIVDFICLKQKLVIELDGGQHCEKAADAERDGFMRNEGFTVLRFWNNEVMENSEGVLWRIHEALASTPSQPSP